MMKKLQEKLDFLLNKYSLKSKAVLIDDTTVEIDGVRLPLLAHRCERRFIELKNMVNNGTLKEISVMRIARIVAADSDIYGEFCREADICQYILQRKLKSVTVMENGNVLNAIATAEDDIVCTIEISATLKCGEIPKDKHEIISQRGIACDVVVDAQLRQDSIYVFGAENRKYTDVDFELYGLSPEEIAMVRAAFLLAQSGKYDEARATDFHLRRIAEAAKKSADTGEREVI